MLVEFRVWSKQNAWEFCHVVIWRLWERLWSNYVKSLFLPEVKVDDAVSACRYPASEWGEYEEYHLRNSRKWETSELWFFCGSSRNGGNVNTKAAKMLCYTYVWIQLRWKSFFSCCISADGLVNEKCIGEEALLYYGILGDLSESVLHTYICWDCVG